MASFHGPPHSHVRALRATPVRPTRALMRVPTFQMPPPRPPPPPTLTRPPSRTL
jgi:hypothetical protein